MERYISLNPATEELIGEFPVATTQQIEQSIASSCQAARIWKGTLLRDRIEAVRRLGSLFKSKREKISALICQEVGKPIAQAELETDRCIEWPEHFAKIAETALGSHRSADVSDKRVAISYEALGTVLAIIPWNFPASLAIRAAVPAILAGNSIIIKSAPNTPNVARAVEAVFSEVGLPANLYQALFLTNDDARKVILDARVQLVSFTGSVEAGRKIAAIAGEGLKRVTLELGGSDPFVVLPDADVTQAVDIAYRARISNAGQVCCSPKRFIVHRSVVQRFTEALVGKVSALNVGDPSSRECQMGPLARADLRDKLASQITRTLACGARIVGSSSCPSGRGFYHPALIINEVSPNSPAASEELFGPVFPIFPYDREEEALSLANSTKFGLGACVIGKDPFSMTRMAIGIESGMVALNGNIGVDPRIPFGGIKESGIGRACGVEGLREFCNVKAMIGI